ncbi:hypothetical protein LXL04_011126 [Taraxacum kok-saghyz]
MWPLSTAWKQKEHRPGRFWRGNANAGQRGVERKSDLCGPYLQSSAEEEVAQTSATWVAAVGSIDGEREKGAAVGSIDGEREKRTYLDAVAAVGSEGGDRRKPGVTATVARDCCGFRRRRSSTGEDRRGPASTGRTGCRASIAMLKGRKASIDGEREKGAAASFFQTPKP